MSRAAGKSLFLAWLLSTLAALVLMGRLGELDEPLKNCATPLGILSYEFAWSEGNAQAMLQAWAQDGVLDNARESLTLDFAYLLAYPISLALACLLLSARLGGELAGVGRLLGWAVLACTPLDALENLALMAMLERGADDFLARVAGLCAGVKFVLIFAAVGCILVSLLAWLRRWLDGRTRP